MTADTILFVYVVVLLAALSVVAILSEMRRRRFRPAPTADQVFRCEKCGFLYTDDPDVERSLCSQCGTMNEAVHF